MFNIEGLFTHPLHSRSLLVAEIGINHDGDIRKALQLIEEAARQGADAVKFQIFKSDAFLHPVKAGSGLKLFRNFELSFQDFKVLNDRARDLDLVFFATPLDWESLDLVVEVGCPLIKVASSDINTEPYLDYLSRQGSRVILSTGMAREDEIEKALGFFPQDHAAVMYCVSEYPADPLHFDLNILPRWREKWGRVTGFSDHSLGIHLSLAAVVMGARIIERHFTLDRNCPGADHAMSLEAGQFGEMSRQIREIESALGSGVKNISAFEEKIRPQARRAMYMGRSMKKGEIISERDILCMRPGPGVSLEGFRLLAGSKAEKDFALYEEI